MTNSRTEYNLAAIRELLLSTFTPQILRRFCLDRADFRPIIADLGADYSLNRMIDQVLDYCRTHQLWDEFLGEVKQEYPRTFARYQDRIVIVRPLPDTCPYRSLEPFETEHADFYFGRQRMVEQLVSKVGKCGFVAVVGPSGCGKSSLVRAGLVTALRKGALPGSENWSVRLFRPGDDPLRELSSLLVKLLEPGASEVVQIKEARRLADLLREGAVPISDVLARLYNRYPGRFRHILVVDQFEETYTECQDRTLQQVFIDTLLSLAGEQMTVVLTLRADFYGRALANRRLGEAIDIGLVNVLPMNEEELQAAVKLPASKTGRQFESGLVERIVGDVAGEPGNLPLLEFALTELWHRQTDESVLTHVAYDAIGQVDGAIAQRAETVFEELESKGHADTVRQIFLRLTHYGEGTEGTRCRVTISELVTPRTQEDAVHQIVEGLARARLLVTDQDLNTEAATVEVAHEALIRGWKRLRGWLDGDRVFGLWRERLAAAVKTWQAMDEDEGTLLRGAPLSEAQNWLRERGDDLNQAERTLIQKSLDRQKQEQTAREKRRRLIMFGLAAGLLVSLFLTFVSFVQFRTADRQSKINQVRELKARALVQTDTNAECALALALKAHDLASKIADFPLYEFEDVVRQVLLNTHVEATLTSQSEGFDGVAWSPDGQRLASAGYDHLIRIWDLASMTSTIVLKGHNSGAQSVAWSPDGQRLASAGGSTILIWDISTETQIAALRGHSGTVWSLAWSPDSKLLASASKDATVRVWDTETGEIADILSQHSEDVMDVAWSPDGTLLATASTDTSAQIWNVESGKLLETWQSTGGQFVSVAWHPSRRRLALAQADGRIQVWDMETDTEVTFASHNAILRDIDWSPDGRRLASASEDGTIQVWDMETLEKAVSLTGHNDVTVSIAWSPNGQRLASASWDGTLRVWRAEPSKSVDVWTASTDFVMDVAWSPDGTKLTSANTSLTIGHDIEIWDPKAARSTTIPTTHTASFLRLAWSPDGSRIASASADNTIQLHDAHSREHLLSLTDHTSPVLDVAWSPDGRQLASGSWDGTIRLWDPDTGQNTAVLTVPEYFYIYSVVWSPDGRHLASASVDETVIVWDAETQEATRTLTDHVASVLSVAWSSQENRLASGSSDGSIIVWDAISGERLTTLTGHGGAISDLAWSPDGSQLASAANDSTVRLWDTTTAETIAILTGHKGTVRAVTWSPDGRRLASAGMQDHTIRIYYADFQRDVLPLARIQLKRGSTPDEQERCLGKP